MTKTLEGVVGFINKTALKTGFDLFPEGKTGLFIEFACLGLTVAVRGSVIVPITPDKMVLTTNVEIRSRLAAARKWNILKVKRTTYSKPRSEAGRSNSRGRRSPRL